MPLFLPTYIFKRITKITPDFLSKQNLKALILDVDNTLTTHGSQQLDDDVAQWLEQMKKLGIKLIICSNNTKNRVTPFAKKIGLDFIHFSCKPSPVGLAKARKKLGVKKCEIALVGDQIFTDVLGANFYGIKMLMVLPMEQDGVASIDFKRKLEKPFIKKYYKKGGKLYE